MSSFPVTCQACGEKSDSIGKHECDWRAMYLKESTARDKLAERVLRLERWTDDARRVLEEHVERCNAGGPNCDAPAVQTAWAWGRQHLTMRYECKTHKTRFVENERCTEPCGTLDIAELLARLALQAEGEGK